MPQGIPRPEASSSSVWLVLDCAQDFMLIKAHSNTIDINDSFVISLALQDK